MIEITATYHGERFAFPNGDGRVVIGDAEHVDGQRSDGDDRKMYAVKGPDDPVDPLRIHGTYRFYGHWRNYMNRRLGRDEKQFHFQTYVTAAPASRAGIIAYLRKHGQGCGVGPKIAARIWERFGADSVRLVRESPEVVATAIKGLSEESVAVLAERLTEQAHVEHAAIELMGLLDNRGFPKATARRCLNKWGNRAAELVKANPFLLMQFRGCGFVGCDKFWLDIGLAPERLKRQALCAWYAIASDTFGHTWHPVGAAVQGIAAAIHGAEPQPERALKLAKRAGLLSTARIVGGETQRLVDEGGELFVAEGKKATQESFVATSLVDARREQPSWPTVGDLNILSDHQREHLSVALSGPVGVFGGSPGTGKTYSAAAVVRQLFQNGSGDAVAVCAPTGKAAVRVTEAMAAYGISVRAKTIHSLLGVESADGGWSFKHGRDNPLPFRFLIVDESSMIDCGLMASLLAARSPGTCVLFVGDINQLPPVGYGAPLRDIIRAGLPYGELTEIRRNAGQIVQACADIRDGKRFECGGNLELAEAFTPEQQTQQLLAICGQAKADGLDPIWDVQILVPVNRKSKVCRQELNKLLQAELNASPGVKGTPFRVGDKLVNTANGWFGIAEKSQDEDVQTNDAGEVYVANGELGQVVDVQAATTIVKLTSPSRVVRVPRGQAAASQAEDDSAKPDTGCSWDLGYALSIHKSQGSEWPRVAIVLDEYPGAKMVFSREAIYTGISRGKERVFMVGKLDTAHRFCKRTQINERRTLLVERFRQEVGNRMLAEL